MKIITSTFSCGALLLASSILTPSAWAGNQHMYAPSLLPSNPQTGQCYARVHIPAQYTTSPQTVMVEEGYSVVEVDQPRLESISEQVEVKQASVRFEVRQPSYRTVSEQMLVRPSYDRLAVEPPRFETVREIVQTSSPRRVWKRGNPTALAAQGYNIISTADGRQGYGGVQTEPRLCATNCEIWCLVEEPGERVSFDRKVMVSPGTVRRVPVPAKYTTVNKQIVADPGGVREIPVPAEYKSVQVERLVDPGGERLVDIPAKYGHIEQKNLVSSDRYEWRQVNCGPSARRGGAVYGGAHTSSQLAGEHRAYNRTANVREESHASGGYGSYYSGYGNATTSSAPITTGTYYYGTNRPVDSRSPARPRH